MSKEPDIGITVKKSEDFSEWFSQLMQKAELADVRYNIKGLPVYRWWAVKSIKLMYRIMEDLLENKGHKPLIFPALIPESNFKLESEHVEGFVPEVFWVTEHGAGEKFEEKMALRPTSETAFYQMFSYWIRSYNDLPFKRYQSCQVWRYEGKATRPFFRTREIHWIEAHDAFATEEEARAQVLEDMKTTEDFLLNKLAMPFVFFQRPEWDKFAGAIHTYAADALMPSGKVLQLPSTHLLGQNFSKPFDVKFKDKDGEEKYPYITCYGPAFSRIYGALIALHGDDKGLILPWDVAPVKIVLIPIIFKGKDKPVLEKLDEIKEKLGKELSEFALETDLTDQTPGRKFNFWEMRGIPIRIEIGPKDVENSSVTVFRRDLGTKETIKEDKVIEYLKQIKESFTKNMIKKSMEMFKDNVVKASSLEEVKKAISAEKMVKMCFCSIDKDGEECAGVIEKEAQAFVRGTAVDEKEKPEGNCAICGKPGKHLVYVARSY